MAPVRPKEDGNGTGAINMAGKGSSEGETLESEERSTEEEEEEEEGGEERDEEIIPV